MSRMIRRVLARRKERQENQGKLPNPGLPGKWLGRRVGAGVVRVVFTTPIFFQPQFFARNKIKKINY